MSHEQLTNSQQLKQSGLQLFHEGRRQEALAAFEAAAAAFGQVGDAAGQAEMDNNIGVIYRLQGSWAESREALERAQATFSELNDVQNEAMVLGNLGDLYATKGDKTKAAQFYGQAAEQFAATGDGQKQAEVLRAFSLMRLRQRDWFSAVDLMAKSLDARPRRGLGQQLFLWMLRLVKRLFAGG